MKFPGRRMGSGVFYFVLPLILCAFTHFWNSADYPSGPSNDEGIYIRRAFSVLSGEGPQESLLYDHPFFSQIFLAGIFSMINYPHFLHPSIDGVDSVRLLFLVPRLIMAIIAVADTALVYLISRYWYDNRTVGFIASSLFAVLPFTDNMRRVLLEPIQLPFFLLSVLFAIFSAKIKTRSVQGTSAMMTTTAGERELNKKNRIKKISFILLSGVFLGLAIFTKIPIFTMIPLVVYVIYRNNQIKKKSLVWFVPVIIIPLLWPAYAFFKNHLNLWFKGIYFQTHRGAQTLLEILKYNFQYDPILISLGVVGIAFSIVKRDLFILLWAVPFLAFLYGVGFVSFWHIIPLFPLFCIAGARMIYELSLFIRRKNIQKVLPLAVLLGISVYSLYGYTEAMIYGNSSSGTTDNTAHFKAIAFIDRYLYNNTVSKTDNSTNNDRLVLISNPFYSWIPNFVFNLKNVDYIDYYDGVSVRSNKVVMLLDPQWEYNANHNLLDFRMVENYKLYGKNKIATFGEGVRGGATANGAGNYGVDVYAYNFTN
jgi:hypothetical protein